MRTKLIEGRTAPRVRLTGGYLEKILDSKPGTWARTVLVWQNGFFGPRIRRTVRPGGWMQSTNAPLPLRPEIFNEVDKYVHLPKEIRQHWLNALLTQKP